MPPADTPFIPQNITVHLGRPDSDAENVTVPFPDYIKNVASSEIYPTWPEAALRANIYAEVSFALNRIYTEFYRNQGYNFDITNSTAFDQAYIHGRPIYENISALVDELFNDYVVRGNGIEPYFTQYCNGTTVTCDGLSQWGTVPLAEEGLGPYDILTRFYGTDINLVENAPVDLATPSYPGVSFRRGQSGNEVLRKQIQLNRISRNYPAIPKIPTVDGFFGTETEDAVKAFQSIFGLEPDGIIGKATWYRIGYIYSAVKRLSELDSEGLSLEEVSRQFVEDLRRGSNGTGVRELQYYLAVLNLFYNQIPPVNISGEFDTMTEESVEAFQLLANLPVTGVVDVVTWNNITRAYYGIIDTVPQLQGGYPLFPGEVLRIGSRGENVTQVQQYLNAIGETFTQIPVVPVNGVFGNQTQAAVIAFQELEGLEPNGIVGAVTWNELVSEYSDLMMGFEKVEEQYPGSVLTEEGVE
ncbi:MAG: peptidoglycan-binding protein [Clostridia bacterium]|nr:peptidoglycan-binding protein [Clostridia bacterium]